MTTAELKALYDQKMHMLQERTDAWNVTYELNDCSVRNYSPEELQAYHKYLTDCLFVTHEISMLSQEHIDTIDPPYTYSLFEDFVFLVGEMKLVTNILNGQ